MSEYEIPRTVFTAEQLRNEPKLPGFFDNGPAHFDERLLDGKNYLNTVYALAMIIKTSEGYMGLAAVRSPDEERQPNAASAVTARETHDTTRKIMESFSSYRVPILGNDSADIQSEGYHITDIDPANPVLVADYEPGQNQERDVYLRHSFIRLTSKLLAEDPIDGSYRLTPFHEILSDATYWLGPTVVGTSEVGDGVSFWTPEASYDYDDLETRYEANAMGTIVAAADVSELTPREIRRMLMLGNKHYSHVDLAPLDTFNYAVQNSVVDLITPGFKERELHVNGLLSLYILACAKGLCLRAAALGLTRHINYAREMFGDKPIDVPPPADTNKIYQMPKKLWLPDR